MRRFPIQTTSLLLLTLLGISFFGEAAVAAIKTPCATQSGCCCADQAGRNEPGALNLRPRFGQCRFPSGCCRLRHDASLPLSVYLIPRATHFHQATPALFAVVDDNLDKTETVANLNRNEGEGHLWPFVPLYLQNRTIVC